MPIIAIIYICLNFCLSTFLLVTLQWLFIYFKVEARVYKPNIIWTHGPCWPHLLLSYSSGLLEQALWLCGSMYLTTFPQRAVQHIPPYLPGLCSNIKFSKKFTSVSSLKVETLPHILQISLTLNYFFYCIWVLTYYEIYLLLYHGCLSSQKYKLHECLNIYLIFS